MKVKVKLDRESQLVDLGDRSAASITLSELQSSVAQLFHLENQPFHLSLNKSDVLEDENRNLSEFGIVSGDLLHIIGSDLLQAMTTDQDRRARPQPLSSLSSQVDPDPHVPLVTSSSSISLSEPSVTGSAMVISSPEDIELEDSSEAKRCKFEYNSSEINRFLHEPLVIQESSGTQVPVLLEQLYTTTNCSCTTDALWVVLHALMLESGFLPDEDIEMTTMPSNYKKSGYYISSYKYSVSQDIVRGCVMIGVTMATSIVVHAYPKEESDFKTQHLQLKTTDFITSLSQDAPETYRALDRLSRLFIDTISLPLTNELITASGFPERQGLLALPYTVKLKILSFLGARSLCRLGQTCQELSGVYKDKNLWRLQYIRDFGKPSDTNLNKNWFELYKEERIRRNSELEARRRIFHVDATDPPWGFPGGTGPFRPFNPGLPFPRMLGGDYDLNPEFTAGLPGLFNNTRPPLQLHTIPLPNRGLNGIDPLQRAHSSNLAGSPFSNNFHLPFM
ncbi:F-box only protein 7 isoform X1 [Biomphalaria glabrata]|nr:F-box only protein 7 isoform X1 [Biomphalaria glabrata]